MSLPDERDAFSPPDGLPDELPPVKPPSVVFILQLFAVPGLIVLSIFGVVFLFGQLATAKEDWRSLVVELRHPNEHRRWRAAHGLAQVLKADEDLKDKGQKLATNREIAQGLAETLLTELKKDSKLDPDLKFQSFLALTLGMFDLPDVVFPPLGQAMQLRHEPEEKEVREQMLEVRKNALAAVALIGGRAQERKQPVHDAEMVATLLEVSHSDDKLVRQVAAFTLGLMDDPQARGRLEEMLLDADELTQIDAAIALVRSGNTQGYDGLKGVLAGSDEPVERGSPREFERFVSLRNALVAVERMSPHLTPEQVVESRKLIEPIATGFQEPRIRVQAQQALNTLEGKAKAP
jgi:hypothetical protein